MPVPALAIDIAEQFIQVDTNHFLAAKALYLNIEVMEAGLTSQLP